MSETRKIGLVPIDRTVAREVALADAEFVTAQGLVTEPVRDLMAGVIGMMSDEMLGRDAWGGYFAYDLASREVIGTCAFKAGPDASGMVEIAYYTFPPFERRGYGSAMARALVSLAEASGEAQKIIAHTLPERNFSSRILERTGFTLKGDVIDPEDGRVWRWVK
jgi:RimJ/RimL family protein N-acetyltransferase